VRRRMRPNQPMPMEQVWCSLAASPESVRPSFPSHPTRLASWGCERHPCESSKSFQMISLPFVTSWEY
jgi:hypothetical protein